MNNITIKNYEEYALDYLEDNLSESQRQQFETFLNENPIIAEELTDLLDFSLTHRALTYNEKQNLKKPVPSSNGRRYLLLSIAAGIFLVAMFIGLINQKTGSNSNKIANEQDNIEHSDPTLPSNNLDLTDDKNQELVVLSKEEEEEVISSYNANHISSDDVATNKTSANNLKNTQSITSTKSNNISNQQSDNKQRVLTQQKTKPEQHLQQLEHNNLEGKQNLSIASENLSNKLTDDIENNKAAKKKNSVSEDPAINQLDNTSDIASVMSDKSSAQKRPEVAPLAELPITTQTLSSELNVALTSNLTDLPDITIHIDDQPDDQDVVASVDKPRKSKRSFLKNLIPESFAGLTKEEVKRSLIPEAFISK